MKQGDKIRVKAGNKFEGRTGTVIAISQNGKTVEVEFNDEATAWHSFVEQELEAIG
jgi:ribosomal protein L24